MYQWFIKILNTARQKSLNLFPGKLSWKCLIPRTITGLSINKAKPNILEFTAVTDPPPRSWCIKRYVASKIFIKFGGLESRISWWVFQSRELIVTGQHPGNNRLGLLDTEARLVKSVLISTLISQVNRLLFLKWSARISQSKQWSYLWDYSITFPV